MKLVLNLGLHKTGTTFLQRSLEETAVSEEAGFFRLPNGWEVCNMSDLLEKKYRFVSRMRTSSETDEMLSELRSALKSRKTNIFLSNENLIGDQYGQDGTGRLYSTASAALEFFDKLGSDFEIEYVFSIRNQLDFIESTFLNLARDGVFFDFSEYCSVLDFEALDYSAFFQKLSEGGRKIQVVPFELIHHSPETFLKAFSRKLHPEITLKASKDTRPSFSAVALEIAQHAFPKLDAQARQELGDFLSDRLSTRERTRATMFPDPVKKILRSHFSPHNQKFFAQWIADDHQFALHHW